MGTRGCVARPGLDGRGSEDDEGRDECHSQGRNKGQAGRAPRQTDGRSGRTGGETELEPRTKGAIFEGNTSTNVVSARLTAPGAANLGQRQAYIHTHTHTLADLHRHKDARTPDRPLARAHARTPTRQ